MNRTISPYGALLFAALVVGLGGSAPGAEDFAFFHENVMGTSLELRVQADDAKAAARVEARVLAEIDRLSSIFSGYDPTSEFRRWQDGFSQPRVVSKELFEVLQASDTWNQKSGGAFDARVQILTALWSRCERDGRSPTTVEIAEALERMRRPAWRLDPVARTAERLGDAPLSLNAIAKGYILESACNVAMERGVRGLLLNVGGDMRACGEVARAIGVSDPRADSESSEPLAVIEVSNRAVATSSRSQRGFRIAGRWYSHIFDPRSGRPAEGTAGATVIARSSTDADALATILNVVSPEEGLKLAATLDDVECMIVREDGHVFKSPGWGRFEKVRPVLAAAVQDAKPAKPAWDADHELAIDYEINNPDPNSRRYRRPYVAIWIEDKEGKPVRTLALWLSLGGSGPDRWLPDMKRWYRVDKTVKAESKIDLVHTIARATRQPGKYSVVWDGKDDKGNLVAAGDYTVLIEAAREHGTYQIIRQPVTLAGKPFVEELKGNVEIKSASLAYRRKAQAK
jgi:FAD:protein FMN transferase